MDTKLSFSDRVAVITGAGNGLGRSHAHLLAARGAKIVVNDLGGTFDGRDPGAANAAHQVAEEIRALGGEAVADTHDVARGDDIIAHAMDTFGRVDIVICNAGILRDRSFGKMSDEEWRQVIDVHLHGSFKTARAAWRHMLSQHYGRVVFTASGAGLYGNFGQANYSAAKLGIYGLTRALAIEGERKNIRANCIAPLAASRMAGTVFNQSMMQRLRPEAVSPLVAYLCHEQCPDTGAMFEVGGGWQGKLRWERSAGAAFDPLQSHTIEDIAAAWTEITSFDSSDYPRTVADCFAPFAKNLGIEMDITAANATHNQSGSAQ